MDEKSQRVAAQNLGFIANTPNAMDELRRREAEYRKQGNTRAAAAMHTRAENRRKANAKAAQTVRNLVDGRSS